MSGSLGLVAVLDAADTERYLRSYINLDGSCAFFHEIEVGGQPASGTNGLPVVGAGSLGSDSSSNNVSLPAEIGLTIGVSVYGGAGPFAVYVLVGVAPANTNRAAIYVENVSGQQVVCTRDDGTAAVGAAPANASWFLLSGGGAVPSQGGSWQSTTFKGRLLIWSQTDPGVTARPTIMED